MVDAIVSFAVQRLGDSVFQEIVSLHGVKDEVVSLQRELNWMRFFLKDAEQKQDGNEGIRIWISEIQDIAYDTEDVIETFIFKAKEPIQTSRRDMLSNSVKNCFGICTIVECYGISKEIKALKNRVFEVSRKRETYGINTIGVVQEGISSRATKLRDLRLTSPYVDVEYVVGFEDDAQFLQAKLFLQQPRRGVISILGMGGLGKTTLARKLYNNTSTKFNLHAWVCVSQEWNTRDLLERLIKSFKKVTKDELEMLEKMRNYDMEEYLRDILEGRKYLVVIDDVWDIEAWQSLRRALPDNQNGSRIIITTRKESVAELSDQRTYVHKLRFLRPDESWQLFCKKAFPENSGACPSDMEELGKQMMAKCGGLPLAIIVLGGLLSRKQFHEWHVVKDHIWRELKNDSIYISSLLALSYKDLPHELKSCFLYLGMFPEDVEINTEKLIRLWIAEQFITGGGLDLEEVAENYLKELIGRSLIQVAEMKWGTTSKCRVHDLLRDLAVNKAKELNFLHISDETMNLAPSTVASSYRRIAIRSGFESYKSLDRSHHRVRTLSFLSFQDSGNDIIDDSAEGLMTLVYSRFTMLRVLDLEGVRVTDEVKSRFDEGVENLIHLRYLGLNHTGISGLPESIENLQALQTLDVSNNCQIMLPKGISKLKQLRHLIGVLHTEKGISHLVNAFAKLQNLKVLSVEFHNSYRLSVQALLNCRQLIQLKISARIENLPKEMHKSLSKLKHLELRYSALEEDPMPALEMLPNLMVLHIDCVQVNNMTCTATGFPQLEVLKLFGFWEVKMLQVEEGAMPRLRALSLDYSIKQILPERLRSLPDAGPLSGN